MRPVGPSPTSVFSLLNRISNPAMLEAVGAYVFNPHATTNSELVVRTLKQIEPLVDRFQHQTMSSEIGEVLRGMIAEQDANSRIANTRRAEISAQTRSARARLHLARAERLLTSFTTTTELLNMVANENDAECLLPFRQAQLKRAYRCLRDAVVRLGYHNATTSDEELALANINRQS